MGGRFVFPTAKAMGHPSMGHPPPATRPGASRTMKPAWGHAGSAVRDIAGRVFTHGDIVCVASTGSKLFISCLPAEWQ